MRQLYFLVSKWPAYIVTRTATRSVIYADQFVTFVYNIPALNNLSPFHMHGGLPVDEHALLWVIKSSRRTYDAFSDSACVSLVYLVGYCFWTALKMQRKVAARSGLDTGTRPVVHTICCVPTSSAVAALHFIVSYRDVFVNLWHNNILIIAVGDLVKIT